MTALFLVIAEVTWSAKSTSRGSPWFGRGAVRRPGMRRLRAKEALPGMVGALGLLLFLYCVGIRSGGEWFRGLRAVGTGANAVACVALAASAAVALVVQRSGVVGPA